MNPIFVVAGSKEQFHHFVRVDCDDPEESARYLHVPFGSDKILRGRLTKDTRVVFYGSYYLRKDIERLRHVFGAFGITPEVRFL